MGNGKDRGGLIAGGQLFGYDTILGLWGHSDTACGELKVKLTLI